MLTTPLLNDHSSRRETTDSADYENLLQAIQPRWLFFFLNAYTSTPGIYTVIFYRRFAFDSEEMAFLQAAQFFCGLIGSAYLCSRADTTNKHPIILMASCLIATVLFELQIATLPFSTYIPNSLRFVFTILFASVSSFFSSACYPILVSIVVKHLRNQGGREGVKQFGNERTGGSLGTGVNVLLLGLLFDFTGTLSAFVALAAWCGCVLSSIFLFSGGNDSDDDTEIYGHIDQKEERWEVHPVDSSWKTIIDVVQCLFRGTFWTSLSFFALTVACFGGIAMVEQLTFMYLIEKYHARSIICGLIASLGTVSELICFSYSGELSERYGVSAMLCSCSLWLVVRLCIYSVAGSIWVYVGLGLVRGTTFALFHSAAVMLVADRVPEHLQASGQFVLSGAQCFGRFAIVVVWGWDTENYNAETMFLSTGLMLLTSTLVYFLAGKLERQNNSAALQMRSSTLEQVDIKENEEVVL